MDKVMGRKVMGLIEKGKPEKGKRQRHFCATRSSITHEQWQKNVFGGDASPLSQLGGVVDETVEHIVAECPKLVQEYKLVKHDNVAKVTHWKLCEKWEFQKAERWYMHNPQNGLESDKFYTLWDFPIKIVQFLEYERPEITVIIKGEWSHLGKLKKYKKISLLNIEREILFLLYLISKFSYTKIVNKLKSHRAIHRLFIMCYLIISSILDQTLFLIFRKTSISFTATLMLFSFSSSETF